VDKDKYLDKRICDAPDNLAACAVLWMKELLRRNDFDFEKMFRELG
jgi:hypothetical protein